MYLHVMLVLLNRKYIVTYINLSRVCPPYLLYTMSFLFGHLKRNAYFLVWLLKFVLIFKKIRVLLLQFCRLKYPHHAVPHGYRLDIFGVISGKFLNLYCFYYES